MQTLPSVVLVDVVVVDVVDVAAAVVVIANLVGKYWSWGKNQNDWCKC